jgi:hypothetical protein
MQHVNLLLTDNFPNHDFAIKLRFIYNEFEQDYIEASYGDNTKIKLGYNSTHDKKMIEYQVQYSDNTIKIFDALEHYDHNPMYHNIGENELVFVIDNLVRKEISIFLNDYKLQSTPFADTKKIKRDTTKSFTVTSLLEKDGINVIDVRVIPNIPFKYSVNTAPSSTITSVMPDDHNGNSLALAQCPIFNNQNITNAWNNDFNTTADIGWVRLENNQSLWGWVDMGKECTLERLRLWINAEVDKNISGTDGFRVYATNNASLTTAYLPADMHFFHYTTHVAALQSLNKNRTESSQETTLNGYDYEYPTGTWTCLNSPLLGTINDPVRTVTKNASSGYHRFNFCNYFNKYQRTGRYYFFEFYPTTNKTQIVEFNITGNYTNNVKKYTALETKVLDENGEESFTVTKERDRDETGKMFSRTRKRDKTGKTKTMTKKFSIVDAIKNFTNTFIDDDTGEDFTIKRKKSSSSTIVERFRNNVLKKRRTRTKNDVEDKETELIENFSDSEEVKTKTVEKKISSYSILNIIEELAPVVVGNSTISRRRRKNKYGNLLSFINVKRNDDDTVEIEEKDSDDDEVRKTTYASDGVSVLGSKNVTETQIDENTTQTVEVNKDASGNVVNTTTTVVDEEEDTVTVAVTSTDQSVSETIYEADGVTVKGTATTTTPVTVVSGVTESTKTEKDASDNVIGITTITNNTITNTVTAIEKTTGGETIKTTTTVTDAVENSVTKNESYPDQSSLITVYELDGITVKNTTEISAPVDTGEGFLEITTTVKDASGNVVDVSVETVNTNDYNLYESGDYVFKYNYKSHNTDRQSWNKSMNDRWSSISENGVISYTWSGKKDTNTKNGIYLMLAKSGTSLTSGVIEIKYDTSYDYMLPCVVSMNDTTTVIAYVASNGSTYIQNIYYNIITHNNLEVVTNNQYSFSTEKFDQNLLIDINKLNDTDFIIAFNDFAQHPRYQQCNCGRHGCHNCHVGWYYYYDIQYYIYDINNTHKLNRVVFQNNDTSGNYHKLTTPSIGVSENYYTVVYQYYSNVYTYSMRKSDNGVTTSNRQVNSTGLPTWHHNDCLPTAIESFTTDQFVYVWYDNYGAINQTRKIFMRQINAPDGAYITSEILIDTFTSTDNKYILGRPRIFKNVDYYDLIIMIMEKPEDGLFDHNTYRLHYKIANDTSFTILNKTEFTYDEHNLIETIGNPLSIIPTSTGNYQETIVYTLQEATSQFFEFDFFINTGIAELPESSIRSYISNVSLGNAVSVSGTVKADYANASTYYIVATLDSLSELETKNLMNDPVYSTLLVSDTIGKNSSKTLSGVSLNSIVDNTTGTKQIISAEYVNYVNVYVYIRLASIASEQLNGTANGTTLNASNGSSTIISGGYYQNLPSGDKIHSSSSFQSSRAVASLFDGYSGNNGGNWNNAWHGASGATTMTAVYEFASGDKAINSMSFVNVPSSHHAGVINIYYWDGSAFIEVNYTNNNEFSNNDNSGKLNVTFNTVTSSQFKIQVNRHSSNATTYVGLSEWTIYQEDTTGTPTYDYVDNKTVTPETNNPYVTISDVSAVESQKLTITGSAFSSIANISEIKVGAFDSSVDLSDESALAEYMNQYGITINTSTIPRFSVFNINQFEVNTAFTGDLTSSTTTAMQDGTEYKVVLYTVDALNNSIITHYILRYELYDTQVSTNKVILSGLAGYAETSTFKFNYKSHNTDRYSWNKSMNDRWSSISDSGIITYTWSGKKDNYPNKNGIYIMFAKSGGSTIENIIEIKSDTSYDYMFPCVVSMNDSTVVVAYVASNGSTYIQNIYYNIITHDNGNILTNNQYSFSTEKFDQNLRIDINKLNDTDFIIAFDDFAQHPRYQQCNCGRHGCHNCHVGWYYYYDIQYYIYDINNTHKLNRVVFQNNDTNNHYHKLTTPSIGVSENYYTVVYQYYAEVYTYSMRKSDNGVTTNNVRVNTTSLPTWHHNDCLPTAIESFTTDQFVYVWYDNYGAINQNRRIFMRQINAPNGSHVTSEILIDTFTSTDNKYILGRPRIFKNASHYDLFVLIMDKSADGLPDHPTHRIHYELTNDTSFTLINKTTMTYNEYNIMENIGNPLSILPTSVGTYQEIFAHTSEEPTTQYSELGYSISSGPLLEA